MNARQPDKVQAIYELRKAAEHKAFAEVAVDREGTPEARDALLDATLQLEAKTQDAIEVCHFCGRPHAGNVVEVDFRREPDAR